MEGQCRLCKRYTALQLSYVLPAFTFKRKKKGGGHIRHSATINRRVQDGAKEYWLCSKCEGLFNVWETNFSNAIFHPANCDGLPSISYGDWLLKVLHLRFMAISTIS